MLKLKKVMCIAAIFFLWLPVFSAQAIPVPVSHVIKGRCSDDQANSHEQIVARNAWCLKCGYSDPEEVEWNNARDKYITFTNLNAPWDASHPCEAGGVVLGECRLAGCYTPGQRLMFAGTYMPIDDAAWDDGVSTVTSLRPDWFMEDTPAWVEEPIGAFVLGDENKPVLRIATENGFSLEVTDNHPMVDVDGNVLPASDIVESITHLLTEAGDAKVVSVTSRPYHGKVWNIEPESVRTEANIHLAEGFVTGSVRFQDEWAKDASRLHLRRRINANPF